MYSMAERIRRARRTSGLTQAQLAAAVGVKRSAVAQWEQRHGTSPNTLHLSLIAQCANVMFEWLATGRGRMRLDGNEFEMALVTADFARDSYETQVLQLLRQATPQRKKLACEVLQLIVRAN